MRGRKKEREGEEREMEKGEEMVEWKCCMRKKERYIECMWWERNGGGDLHSISLKKGQVTRLPDEGDTGV